MFKKVSITNLFFLGSSCLIGFLTSNINDIADDLLQLLLLDYSFLRKLHPTTYFGKWIYIWLIFNLYLFLFYGVYSFFNRDKRVSSVIACEEELGETIKILENNVISSNQKLASVINLIKEYEKEITASLGNVDKKNYRLYWLIPSASSTRKWKTISLHRQAPDETEKKAIDNAIHTNQPHHCNRELQKEFTTSKLHDIFLARNYGEFSFGFTILCYNKEVIDDLIEHKLIHIASQIMLLGSVDHFKIQVVTL